MATRSFYAVLEFNNDDSDEPLPNTDEVAAALSHSTAAEALSEATGCGCVNVGIGLLDDKEQALLEASGDLLAACHKLVAAWERGEPLHYGDPQSFTDPIGIARTTIKKAKGGA